MEEKRFKLIKTKSGDIAIEDEIRGCYVTVNKNGAKILTYWLNDLNE